ncbi:hypothetical protein SAMN04487764_1966 [Gillisia sp. Hel1_33_143]|uniref:hypothetical protein n=1 Tax=unclassified Gillisia TaxID=2615025 RepID=UPI000550F7AF|nr:MULTISPECIES: hypothetical protein [unclassified Gillisia]SDS32733.1 hypothetical protein SAMN04487764_1966 [Gillisia sp. Hel1_33_143]
MKITAINWLVITTVLLITLCVLANFNISFGIIFGIMLIGQALLIFSVYKILRDNYSTDKTFKDLYEDRPDLGK